jgi:hypothetical protein
MRHVRLVEDDSVRVRVRRRLRGGVGDAQVRHVLELPAEEQHGGVRGGLLDDRVDGTGAEHDETGGAQVPGGGAVVRARWQVQGQVLVDGGRGGGVEGGSVVGNAVAGGAVVFDVDDADVAAAAAGDVVGAVVVVFDLQEPVEDGCPAVFALFR